LLSGGVATHTVYWYDFTHKTLSPIRSLFSLDRNRLLLMLSLGIGLFWVWLLTGVPLDDAYIYIRYAENTARGMGPVFNTADPVEGYTGFLWFAILTAFAFFKARLDLVSQALSVMSYAGLLLTLYAYAKWRYGSSFFAVLPAILFSLSVANAFWTGFALETMLFGFLTLNAVHLYLRFSRGFGQKIFTGLVALLASLTRPEGIVVYLLLLLFETACQLKEKKRVDWAGLAAYAAPLLIYGFYLLSRHAFYGYFLPNTYYVKVGLNALFLRRGVAYLLTFINNNLGGFYVFTAVLLHGFFFRRKEKEWWLLFSVTLCLFATVILSGGDWWPFSRHALVSYPFAILLTNEFLRRLFESAASLRDGWRRLKRICGTFLIAFIAFTGVDSLLNTTRQFPASVFLPGYNRGFHLRAKFYGLLFKKLLLPHQFIALSPMPTVAHFYGGRVLDMLGLTDPKIAHRKLPMGIKTHSHEKGDGRYVLSMRPTIIIFKGDLYFLNAPGDYPLKKDLIFISDREIVDIPAFYRLYEPYSVKAGNTYVTFFKIKTSTFNDVPQEEIDDLYHTIKREMAPTPNEVALERLYQALTRIDGQPYFKFYRKLHSALSFNLRGGPT
jgi:hypothetical protein